MRLPPTVRVLETLEPIPLDSLHELRVELVDVDGIRRIRVREWERPPIEFGTGKPRMGGCCSCG